jgi:hypothetical protein
LTLPTFFGLWPIYLLVGPTYLSDSEQLKCKVTQNNLLSAKCPKIKTDI